MKLIADCICVIPPNAVGIALQSVLWAAVHEGDTGGIELALQSGANVNEPNPAQLGETVLHLAASKGFVGCVDLLLSRGARSSVRSNSGATPLHLGAEGGDVGVVKSLVRSGADVNADCYPDCLWTPLYFAAAHGHYDAAKFLLENGARVHLKDDMDLSPLDVAERWRQRPRDVRNQDDNFDPGYDGGKRKDLVDLLSSYSNKKPRDMYEQSVGNAEDPFGLKNEDDISDAFSPKEEAVPSWGGAEGGFASHIPLTEREIDGTIIELDLGTPNAKVCSL